MGAEVLLRDGPKWLRFSTGILNDMLLVDSCWLLKIAITRSY